MSSIVATASAQQKFTNIRKRLDQLGYRQPLGLESLPLVERLFSDLVHTTDSLKQAKLNTIRTDEQKDTVGTFIEPYKSDNAKLIKENNELHQRLIKNRENLEFTNKDLKSNLRKLEHEQADLRFLNNQYVHKIRVLEKESKSKSDRILELQEKNLHAVVQTPGGRKKNIPFRRQRMEIDSVVPPLAKSESTSANPPVLKQDPYIADLLSVADDKIASMNSSIENLKDEKDQLNNKLNNFRQQVDTRDGEIERLTRLLEGGRPHDVVALEARNRANERLISHLNIQIDYLQQKNQDLQKSADKATREARTIMNKSLDLDSRNLDLEGELRTVDRMAQKLQIEKASAIQEVDNELTEAKIELETSRRDLNTLDKEIIHQRDEISELKAQLSIEKSDKLNLEDMIDKIQGDKKYLGERVTTLTNNERDLILEIDRLKHKNGLKKPNGPKSSLRLEKFISGLEGERDYFKGEVDTLQRLLSLRSSGSPKGRRSRSVSPLRSTSPRRTPSRNKSPRVKSPARNSKNNSGEFDALVRVLEEERDHYKNECHQLKMSSLRSKSADESTELIRVRQERDDLQNLLDKFERHMAEIQANVKLLTAERDQLDQMYQETKDELLSLRRHALTSPITPPPPAPSSSSSLGTQAQLRRAEQQRDDAQAQLRRVNAERDTFQQRLKIATDSHLAERARLDKRIDDLEAMLRKVDAESGSACSTTDSLQKLVKNLEAQLKDRSTELVSVRDQAAQHRATVEQMRLLTEQAERSLAESQRVSGAREAELRDRVDCERRACADLEAERTARMSDQRELSRTRSSLAAIDAEKDALQAAADERAEQLVLSKQEISRRDVRISELRKKIDELEMALNISNSEISSKEREIVSLRRQVDGTTDEISEMVRVREASIRENRRLQDDLATMTRENQSLHNEIQDCVREQDQLKSQLQDYILEVKRIEEVLATKESERSDLLEQYRSLSQEAERYETHSHQLESEGSSLRLELVNRDNELRHMQERIETMQREISDHINNERQYEKQLSSLTHQTSRQEEVLKTSEQDKNSLLQDLAAVRDLCTHLETNNDALAKQLTLKTMDTEQQQEIIDSRSAELEALRNKIASERSSVKSLESLLQNNREKEFQIELSRQETDAELQMLKDRLKLNESKIDGQTREIGSLRTLKIELEAEIDSLKRQVTNERFERERAVQELRRNNIAPPGERMTRIPGSGSPLRISPYHSRSISPGASPVLNGKNGPGNDSNYKA